MIEEALVDTEREEESKEEDSCCECKGVVGGENDEKDVLLLRDKRGELNELFAENGLEPPRSRSKERCDLVAALGLLLSLALLLLA